MIWQTTEMRTIPLNKNEIIIAINALKQRVTCFTAVEFFHAAPAISAITIHS